MMSAMLTFLVGGRYSVGYASGHWRWLYSHGLPIEGEAHEVDRNLEMVRAIVGRVDHSRLALRIWISEDDRGVAANLLTRWKVSRSDLVIGIHPGSGPLHFKRWDWRKFASLSDRLIRGLNAKVIMLGGPEEMNLARSISGAMSESPLIAVGETTLKQTSALIERCTLLVSNDSGLMHVAAAMKVPVVAIFGPTSFGRSSPYGTRHLIVKADVECRPCYRGGAIDCDNLRCLNRISVDDVVDAVRKLAVENGSLSA
jgi:heptosyltransferase-2